MPENTATDSSPSFDYSKFAGQVADLCDEWNSTEEWVKWGEHFVGYAVVLPSINELRYAGRRLADACDAARRGDAQKAEQYLQSAGENLIKARHDVVDAVVYYIFKESNKIRDAVGAGGLQKYFPQQYGELFGLLKTLSQKTVQSRGDRTRRNGIYEEIMKKDLPALEKVYGALEASLPAIEQNVTADNQKAVEETRRYRLQLGFRILGIAVTVLGIAVAIFLAVWVS